MGPANKNRKRPLSPPPPPTSSSAPPPSCSSTSSSSALSGPTKRSVRFTLPPPANENDAPGPTAFQFGFFSNGDEDHFEEELPAHPPLPPVESLDCPLSHHYVQVRAHHIGGPEVGRILQVDWEGSTHFLLRLMPLEGEEQDRDLEEGDDVGVDKCYYVPPSKVALLVSHKDRKGASPPSPGLLTGCYDGETILHLDSTWGRTPTKGDTTSGGGGGEGGGGGRGLWSTIPPAPLTLEPGLDSYTSPLGRDAFLRDISGKKAVAIQGTSERLARLRQDLCDFNVPRLLASATKIVVWMKDVQGGQMQYVDVGAGGGGGEEMALACYRAGHSLYFNPGAEVQREYVECLGQDLGLSLAMEMEGSKGIGGDMEMFAVKGKHLTNWHFDAQENFTIQLVGIKRWWLCPSGLPDPLTNLHPSSSNHASITHDTMVHRSHTDADLKPPGREEEEGGRVVSLTLRPGSVLYVPGGWWHRVEALQDTGSLSLNMSVDGCRYSDVLLRNLGPILWREPQWRQRLTVTNPDVTRATFAQLLARLPQALAQVDAEDFLPDGVMEGGGGGGGSREERRKVVVDYGTARRGQDDEYIERAEEQSEIGLKGVDMSARGRGFVCRRNGLVVLTMKVGGGEEDAKGRVRAALCWGFTQEQFEPSVKVEMEVTRRLEGLLGALACLPPGEETHMDPRDDGSMWAVGGMETDDWDERGRRKDEWWLLVGVLVYHGYLRICWRPRSEGATGQK